MTPRKDMPVLMQQVLKEATPSLRELADETGLVYATMKAWSAGHRTPSAESAEIVAGAVRARALRLLELAERLEKAAQTS